MKAVTVLLLAICTIECRKIVPINKNANIDFINMESGGVVGPARPVQTAPAPAKPQSPEPPKTPTPSPQPKPAVPAVTTVKPVPVVTTAKAVPAAVTTAPSPSPVKPIQAKPVQPSPLPTQLDLEWKPLPAKPNPTGSSTPGYGSVKQLVTFYDSQGKGSVIRPYSYSDAVKQG